MRASRPATWPAIPPIAARRRACAPALAVFAFSLACSGGAERSRQAATAGGAVPAGSGAETAADGRAAATIAGEAIPYKAFERYLADTTGDAAGAEDQDDTFKSRLFDQFVEERVLLAAARRLKLSVSEDEVGGYLKEIGVTEGEAELAGGEGKEAFREKVRESLVLQKLKDEAVLSKVQVTPGEVEDYFRRQPDLFRAPRAVVLRQILIDDRSLADRLAATLAAEPARFEAVAREHSVAPDRGQARRYTEEELPEELREPLFRLQPGQTSGVLEHAQRFLIFQLVDRIEAQNQDLMAVRRRIQMELFQKKGEQALQRYIADLKKETEIRVNRAALPFDYVGEHRN